MITGHPGQRPVASLVSCRRKYLAGLLAALEACGVRPSAPSRRRAPCCGPPRSGTAPRGGRRRCSGPSSGPTAGLVALVAGELPLVWRSFDLPAGGEAGGDRLGLPGAADRWAVLRRRGAARRGPGPRPARPVRRRRRGGGRQGAGGAGRPPRRPGARRRVDRAWAWRWAASRRSRGSTWPARSSRGRRSARSSPGASWRSRRRSWSAPRCSSLGHGRGVEHAHRAVRAEAARFAWLAKVDDGKLDKEQQRPGAEGQGRRGVPVEPDRLDRLHAGPLGPPAREHPAQVVRRPVRGGDEEGRGQGRRSRTS